MEAIFGVEIYCSSSPMTKSSLMVCSLFLDPRGDKGREKIPYTLFRSFCAWGLSGFVIIARGCEDVLYISGHELGRSCLPELEFLKALGVTLVKWLELKASDVVWWMKWVFLNINALLICRQWCCTPVMIIRCEILRIYRSLYIYVCPICREQFIS